MPTAVEPVVDTDGTGDYTSLASASADDFGATSAALTTNDENVVCTCICTGGTVDTGDVNITGRTTDATRNIKIVMGSGYGHTGKYPSGNKYRMYAQLTISDAYTEVVHLAIADDRVASDPIVAVAANNVTISEMVAEYAGSATEGIIVYVGVVTNCVIKSSLFIGSSENAYGVLADNSNDTTVSSCLATLCAVGFVGGSTGTLLIDNNIAWANGTDYFGTTSGDNNAFSNGTDPGSNGIDISGEAVGDLFTNAVSGDFSLALDLGDLADENVLYRTGTNLYAAGVTTDILGNPRTATINFDVGPFQAVIQSREVTVDPDGTGDYSSQSSLIADVGTGTPASLVAYNETLTINAICTGGSADDAGYAFYNVYTTSATNTIHLFVPELYRHGGKASTVTGNVYRLDITPDAALLLGDDHMTVTGMCTITRPNSGYVSSLYIAATNILVEDHLSICYGTAATVETYGVNIVPSSGREVFLRNVVTHSSGIGGNYGLYLSTGTGATVRAHACTFVSPNLQGVYVRAGNDVVLKNCFIHGSTTYGDVGGANPHTDSTNNAFFHGTAPATGSNWKDYTGYGMASVDTKPGGNLGLLFTDPENGDYSLIISEKIGADLSSDSDLAVVVDIVGTSRAATPNIGAFEQAEALPASPPDDPTEVSRLGTGVRPAKGKGPFKLRDDYVGWAIGQMFDPDRGAGA